MPRKQAFYYHSDCRCRFNEKPFPMYRNSVIKINNHFIIDLFLGKYSNVMWYHFFAWKNFQVVMNNRRHAIV